MFEDSPATNVRLVVVVAITETGGLDSHVRKADYSRYSSLATSPSARIS
ncbi:hypothetical protein [Halorussus aquaticus]|uniref:Uncharacterized protein n=1 Tax=Halorussus aquaticus TaxID=2953748 RepID=A0ABD5Q1K9_9EURY|nr:hypothetical protein [Halorussus aquaticus]